MSTERVIAHKGIAETLVTAVRDIVTGLKAGESFTDPSVKLGPLFSERSAERLVSVLNESKEAGAEVLLGDLARDRAIVQPHIFRGVKPGMKLWDEESFGPGIAAPPSLLTSRVSQAIASHRVRDFRDHRRSN